MRAGAISVARSQIPGNRCHTDKTIEETAMKWLKSKSGSCTSSAGISSITSNYEASQRHMPRENLRTGSDAERQQRDVRPCEISQFKDQEKQTVEAFQSFLNPFQLENSQPLTSLSSSGAAMPE